MAEMMRVNTRISKQMNDWLDRHSNETGIPKSTLIFLALELFIQQKEAFSKIDTLSQLVQDVEILKKVVSGKEA